MSDNAIFEGTPEYYAVIDAYRQTLLTTLEAAYHEIAAAESLDDIMNRPHDLLTALQDMSYQFIIQDYQLALRRWEYQRDQRTRQLMLALPEERETA